MGLYDKFKSDEALEKEGVWVNYGDFKVLLARAGGSNKRYGKIAEKVMEPHRRQLKSGTLDNEVAEKALVEITARACVLGWKTKVGDDWVDGIEGEDGSIIEFNSANVIETLNKLHDLFIEIRDITNDMKVYRQDQLESEAKNS